MNKYIPLVALLLAGLPASCGGNDKSSSNSTVYLDNSLSSNSVLSIETSGASSNQPHGSDNYSFSLSLKVKNLSNASVSVNVNNLKLVREETNADYQVTDINGDALSIDSRITKTLSFSSTIPTSIESERYYFSAKLNDFLYTVKLYETPDSERKDVTVSYAVDGEVVKTTAVKERRALGEDYVYENPSHLSHCSDWRTPAGKVVSNKTIIDEDITFTGSEVENLEFFELSSWNDSSIQKVKYVPSDGIVVVPSTHGKYTVNALATLGVSQLPTLEILYLPSTIKKIYYGNFDKCPKLKEIRFAGTEAEWKAITISATIPSNVAVQFNSSFNLL